MELNKRPEVAHFHEVSEPYAKEYDLNTPEGYSFRIRRERVLEMLPDGHGKKILDLASGPGIMIRGLRKKGYSVVCVDAAPGMIEIAKREAGNDPAVACEVGDAYALRFPDGTFDVVIALGLIEYLIDEDKYLTEMRRVLKPNGLLIVTYPNIWGPWRAWNRFLRLLARPFKKSDNGLLHREYTLARARRELRNHDFEPDAVSYYNLKLVPLPLDRMFPGPTASITHTFEWLARTPLRWMATGFIVGAKRQ